MSSPQRLLAHHHGAGRRHRSFARPGIIKLGLLLSTLGVINLAARPAVAQQASKPATQEDVLTYTFMGSVNLCTLAQEKVAFNPALKAAISMQVAVLTQKHGGKIAGVQNDKVLTEQELANGSVIQTVLQMNAMCGKTLPPDWAKEVNDIVTKIQSIQKNNPPANKPK